MKILDRLGPIVFWRRGQIDEQEASRLETYLAAAFHPLEPRPAFVSDLRERLIHAPVGERRNNEVAQIALLGLAGVLSGLIIFITGVRAMVTLLGALGLLRHAKTPVDKKQTALVS